MKVPAPRDERFEALPGFDFGGRPEVADVADGGGGTLRMHYLDEGPGFG